MVRIDLTTDQANHLAWLLATGHTRTAFIAELLTRVNAQIPAADRTIKN